MEFNGIRKIKEETIGETPHRETYEHYEATSKMMELAFFEDSNRFEIYIQKIENAIKNPGETTALFAEMVRKIQAKANELHEPMTLFLDPIRPVLQVWAETKAAGIIGGWDTVNEQKNAFRKTIYPQNNV